MSDSEIFWIGAFASVLMAVHLIVNIVQFRKLGQEPVKSTEDSERKAGDGEVRRSGGSHQ